MTPELESLAWRVRRGIAVQGRYLATSPAELAQLGTPERAASFARRNGWIFVCHLGGTAYEFFEATRSRHQSLW